MILTGPESTGKTTLANYLSNEFSLPLLEEYSRTYLEHSNGQYEYDELEKMAKKAEKIMESHQALNMIMDTDIITYKAWSIFKYNKISPWLEKQAPDITNNFYLLCYPDLEWKDDPLRENPKDLKELFRLYEQILQQHNLQYFIIIGQDKSRFNLARQIATKYFNF